MSETTLTATPLPVRPEDLFARPTLPVRPWIDPVVDTLGHDPRSWYVEQFWLGTLGPSTTWLMRRLAAGFDDHPDGFDLSLAETAREIGLGDRGGRHSPFIRALVRLCQFDAARFVRDRLEVRRRLAPLTRRQVLRLPDGLRQAHDQWQQSQAAPPAEADLPHRARQLALSLFELGEQAEAVERQLLRWRFHPALCRAATEWAWDQHRIRRASPATG